MNESFQEEAHRRAPALSRWKQRTWLLPHETAGWIAATSLPNLACLAYAVGSADQRARGSKRKPIVPYEPPEPFFGPALKKPCRGPVQLIDTMRSPSEKTPLERQFHEKSQSDRRTRHGQSHATLDFVPDHAYVFVLLGESVVLGATAPDHGRGAKSEAAGADEIAGAEEAEQRSGIHVVVYGALALAATDTLALFTVPVHAAPKSVQAEKVWWSPKLIVSEHGSCARTGNRIVHVECALRDAAAIELHERQRELERQRAAVIAEKEERVAAAAAIVLERRRAKELQAEEKKRATAAAELDRRRAKELQAEEQGRAAAALAKESRRLRKLAEEAENAREAEDMEYVRKAKRDGRNARATRRLHP